MRISVEGEKCLDGSKEMGGENRGSMGRRIFHNRIKENQNGKWSTIAPLVNSLGEAVGMRRGDYGQSGDGKTKKTVVLIAKRGVVNLPEIASKQRERSRAFGLDFKKGIKNTGGKRTWGQCAGKAQLLC